MVQQCTTLSPSSFQVLFVTLLLGALLASAECKRRGGGKPKKARSARVSFDHFRNFHRHLHHHNLYHILAICIIMTLIRQERGLGILLEKAVRHILTFFLDPRPLVVWSHKFRLYMLHAKVKVTKTGVNTCETP